MTKLMEDLKAYLESADSKYVNADGQNAVVVAHHGDSGNIRACIKDFNPSPVFTIQAMRPVIIQH